VSTDVNGNGLGDRVYYGTSFRDNYPLMETQANFATGGSATPTPAPTINPTARPTVTPTPNPTINPTARPTVTPTPAPTATPTSRPTVTPTPPTNSGSWAPGSYGVDQAGLNGGPGPIYINSAVPGGAVSVSSQAALSALPAGTNAVLTTDLSSLTVDRAVNLYGNGHKVATVKVTAAGARVSGVKSNQITIAASSVTVDHCVINATGTAGGIIASGVSNIRILSNDIEAYAGSIQTSGADIGLSYTQSFGIKVTSSVSPVIDGNTVYNGYYNFYVYGCSNIQFSYNDAPDGPRKGRGIEMYFEEINGGRINNNYIAYYPYLGPGDGFAGHYNNHDGLGARKLHHVEIDHNLIYGHYYPFKVYESDYVNIEFNQVHNGGSGIRVGFCAPQSSNNRFEGDAKVGRSIGIYVGDGCTNGWYQYNEVWNNQYGVEIYSYATYHLDGAKPSPSTNQTFKQNYLHNNNVLLVSQVQSGVPGPNQYVVLPSYPAGLTGPTPTPSYTPH
jgi:parallel beta-helix repeat protein